MFDQNTFAGTGILLEDPTIDRTGRGKDRIQVKVKHTYGQTETFFLCVAYGEEAHHIYNRAYEQGMFLTFSGSIKLVTNIGIPHIQVNLDRISALAHYTGPNDGVRAPQDGYYQTGPFDNFTESSSSTNHVGTQSTQQRHPRNNPPQNTSTSQPRNQGRGFSGVPGANSPSYIDKGPFQSNLTADPHHRAPVSNGDWGKWGKAAANGF